MKTLTSTLLAALLCLCLPAHAAPPEILTVAVFDFESKDENVRDLGPKIAALINATLSAEPQIITVERAELEKVLGEQELGLSGTVSPATAAKVGHLTGAKVLVTGRVFKVDKEILLVCKVISTETSRVYGEVAKGPGETSVTDLASELAQKIAKVVNEKGDTLVAKVETREQRVAHLKKTLGEAKRPSVFVKLPERHYGAPANDPAAETELLNLLQETDFPLAERESKADVIISGEAFSAAAGRKGNLFICKARVEIKAVAVKSGKVLVVDSETSTAADLAEQTAGKTALQKAAEALARRIFAKLNE